MHQDLEDALHGPVQGLKRRSCGDPGEILSKRSLHEDLAAAMSHAFMKALVEALGRFLSQDLVSSAPAAAGPFMTIL